MKKHALLVGIDDYLSQNITPSRGAVNDVLALKQVLITKFGFVEENITTLVNHTATYSTILESFKLLVEQARNEPALSIFQVAVPAIRMVSLSLSVSTDEKGRFMISNTRIIWS